ncbi:MAG: hypothetical protein RL634_289 [Bacteroidota bacterium]
MYFYVNFVLNMTYSVLKNYIFIKTLLILLMCSSFLQAQDTILARIYTFDEPVSNLDGHGDKIIARTPSKLYRLGKDNEFEKIQDLDPLKVEKYTWIGKDDRRGNFTTYHTDYIIRTRIISYGGIGAFLPGYHHDKITIAVDGSVVYAMFRGNILRYEITPFYKIKNRWESVRNVYVDDSIKITSTYSAIYKDSSYDVFGLDTIKGINYSSGEATKINGKYYLCSDNLFRLENNRWNPVNFSFQSNHHFRKLVAHKKNTYFLSSECFGRIDLENNQIIDTILLSEKNEYFDIAWLDNRAFVSNKDGYIYVYEEGKPISKVFIGSPVYDINFSLNNKEAILASKAGIYKMTLSDLRATLLYPLYDALQTVFVEGELIVTTSHGLYMVHDNQVREIIPRTEFNKYGLNVFRELIYAGSIEGLFVIDKSLLLNDITNSFKAVEFSVNSSNNILTVSILIALLLIFVVILFIQNRKNKKQVISNVRKSVSINPDSIRQIVLEHSTLISVEAIAEYFETSTVQLNRILKKYNTSGLAVLKSIKQDIVKDMIAQGKSLEEISKRVGYSINYIKRNLL